MADGALLEVVNRLGFADILLWLLSFAIVYGVLAQANVPKQKMVQAIIAMVLAFLVIMSVPSSFIATLSTLSSGLLVVLLGLLVLIVLIEATGIKHYEKKQEKQKHPQTGEEISFEHFVEMPLFAKHQNIMALALVIIAILIFIGAVGLRILGLNVAIDITGVTFLIMIILAVVWMVGGKKGEK